MFTEAVLARGKVERNPAMEALRRHPRNFFVVLGARLAENGLGYFFPVFGLSYVINTLGVPKADALSALMLAFVIELFAILGFAALSDRIGRRPVYMFGALCGIALAFPFFWMVGTKQWIWIALAFILARAVVTAAMFGPQAAYFAELFPPQRRFAGFAFARELGSLLAGGPAPFVATALVAWSGSWWPVACYATLLSACTAVAIWFGPETYEENITTDNTTDGAMHRRGRAAGASLRRMAQQLRILQSLWAMERRRADAAGVAAADPARDDPRRRLRRRRRPLHRSGLRRPK